MLESSQSNPFASGEWRFVTVMLPGGNDHQAFDRDGNRVDVSSSDVLTLWREYIDMDLGPIDIKVSFREDEDDESPENGRALPESSNDIEIITR